MNTTINYEDIGQLATNNTPTLQLHHKRHSSHVTRHTSHVTRHTSHVTRHTSHVTRHTSHISHHTPGVLYNATNLAMKGVASIAAYGYLVETYKGDVHAAEQAYATAAQYVHRDP